MQQPQSWAGGMLLEPLKKKSTNRIKENVWRIRTQRHISI
jgi:hypothetical protein